MKIYTLIPIALIGFAAVQGSKWNFNAATYMDKKYTNAVKGIEVFNDESVKIRFTFEDVLKNYEAE